MGGNNKSKGSGNCSGAKSDSAAEGSAEAQQKTNWCFSKGAAEDSVKDSVEDDSAAEDSAEAQQKTNWYFSKGSAEDSVDDSAEDNVKQGKDVAKGLMEESFKEENK